MLLARLWTAACNLGAYKSHFKPERLTCACSGKPETWEHLFFHCLLYVTPRATLLSTLRLPPPLTKLLSDPRAKKSTLCFLTDFSRFDSLYSQLETQLIYLSVLSPATTKPCCNANQLFSLGFGLALATWAHTRCSLNRIA